MKGFRLTAIAALAAARLMANDPPPSQPVNAVNPPYSGGALNNPFPDSVYGADHGASTLTLNYPFLSPFGRTDHSRGVVTYYCAPFSPRKSEGVYGMDVWLEALGSGGGWSPVALNGGAPDGASSPYQPVNTPNPGPSPAYYFNWTFDATQLPSFAVFRVFIYVYLYNQGGGSQGNFYVASWTGDLYTGAAADYPLIAWDPSSGAVNPAQPAAGSTYEISATAESDNGDLTTISIAQNGAPFASAGAGSGWSSNAAGTAQATAGTTITYTAQATDAHGFVAGPINLTVTVPGKHAQAPISASAATITLGQSFTPSCSGGSGTGAWQFCVGGQTNFDAGTSSNGGTENPNGTWSSSWTAPSAGNYAFWIARDGDAAYLPASPVGPYTLTVLAPAPSGATAPPPASSSSSAASSGTSSSPTTSGSSSSSTGPAPSSSTTGSSPAPASAPSPAPSSSSPSASSSSGSGTTSPSASGSTSSPTSPATPRSSSGSSGTTSGAGANPIVRIRFNSDGEEASLHDADTHGATPIWTDPSSIQLSPWPAFTTPAPATINLNNVTLPAIPTLP